MKQYELMTIIEQNADDTGARDVSNSVKDLISSNKGKVLNSDFMGKRKFAYPVKGNTEGFYEVISFEIEPKNLLKFKKKLGLAGNLVRYLITSA